MARIFILSLAITLALSMLLVPMIGTGIFAENMTGMASNMTGNMTGMASNMTGNMTGMASNMTGMASNMTGMASNMTGNMTG